MVGKNDEGRAMVSESNGEISCSIEETNRIRASLGLRPLDVGDSGVKPKEGTKDAPIDASEIRAEEERLQKTAEIQSKIQEMKQQRQVAAKVMARKGLGDSSDDDDTIDNAANWVNRSREKQKEMAEKLARKLQEQDEAAQEEEEYTSSDLRGMKVQHDADAFQEGETIILTLADKRVLRKDGDDVDVNDDEDELENIHISELEKDKRAKEKAKRPRNIAIDDDEFTKYDMLQRPHVDFCFFDKSLSDSFPVQVSSGPAEQA
jgi:U4/U6.U5 tri-snRNP-associated protein 1